MAPQSSSVIRSHLSNPISVSRPSSFRFSTGFVEVCATRACENPLQCTKARFVKVDSSLYVGGLFRIDRLSARQKEGRTRRGPEGEPWEESERPAAKPEKPRATL
jgi:hypothetical protein